jgi:serine protease Do
MKNAKFAIFGCVLTGLVAAAVSGLVAQSRPESRAPERTRPRAMMLDGRGGQLGVIVGDLDAERLESAGAPSGVRIDGVDADSPAAKAGLREGDIVVDVDGDRVRSARQFSRLIQETAEGRSVALGIVRDGKRQTVSVTPESRSFSIDTEFGREVARGLRDMEPRLREFRFGGPFSFDFEMLPRMTSPRGRLGVQLHELSPQLADYFGATEGGVLVSSVTKDSAAEKAGIRAGDVITSINGDRVRGSDDLIDELRDVSGGEITIGIIRDKQASSVKATIEDVRPARRHGRPI